MHTRACVVMDWETEARCVMERLDMPYCFSINYMEDIVKGIWYVRHLAKLLNRHVYEEVLAITLTA